MGDVSIGRALRRGWWIVAACLVAALATAAIVTARATPIYRATTMLVVAPSDKVEETDEVLRGLETLERRTIVATFARIPSTRGMKQRVADRMTLQTDALRDYRLRASVVPYTNAIEIETTGPDPDRAEAVASAAAEVTKSEANAMYPIFELRDFERADASHDPVDPDPRRNLLVAAVAGLFVGLVGAFAVEYGRGQSRGSGRGE